jgi:hypothetical protein
MPRYKVTVTFQGIGALEIDADSPEAARLAVKELTIADMARAGRTDIFTFQVSAREIIPVGSDDSDTEEQAHKPRPSGWYRPG